MLDCIVEPIKPNKTLMHEENMLRKSLFTNHSTNSQRAEWHVREDLYKDLFNKTVIPGYVQHL